MDLHQRQHPQILAETGMGYWGMEKWLSAYNACVIYQMAEDRAKVTISCLYKVIDKVSIGAKRYHLE